MLGKTLTYIYFPLKNEKIWQHCNPIPTWQHASLAVSILRPREQISVHHGHPLSGLSKHESLSHLIYTFLSGRNFLLNYDVSLAFQLTDSGG